MYIYKYICALLAICDYIDFERRCGIYVALALVVFVENKVFPLPPGNKSVDCVMDFWKKV